MKQCLNFRFIIDGPGSNTVRNGNEYGKDERYTRKNTFMGGKLSYIIHSYIINNSTNIQTLSGE